MGQHGDRRCNQVVGADSGGASGVPECCSADFQCSYKLSKPATARASSPALLRSEKYTVADHSPLDYFKLVIYLFRLFYSLAHMKILRNPYGIPNRDYQTGTVWALADLVSYRDPDPKGI